MDELTFSDAVHLKNHLVAYIASLASKDPYVMPDEENNYGGNDGERECWTLASRWARELLAASKEFSHYGCILCHS